MSSPECVRLPEGSSQLFPPPPREAAFPSEALVSLLHSWTGPFPRTPRLLLVYQLRFRAHANDGCRVLRQVFHFPPFSYEQTREIDLCRAALVRVTRLEAAFKAIEADVDGACGRCISP